MPDSHTIAENLTRLATARTNIATAITTKGGTVASGAGLEDFPTAIGTIPSGGGGDDSFAKLVDRSIVTAVIPSGVTRIGTHAFYKCSSLTSVTIPSGVTLIDEYAFELTGLTSVIVPSGVTNIAAHAFNSCSHLQSVTLPDTLTLIGGSAFTNATSLTSLTIPASNNLTIYASAFAGLTHLETLTFAGTTPPTLNNANVWTNLPTTCTIRVPTGSLTAYTTASKYPDPNTYTYVEY